MKKVKHLFLIVLVTSIIIQAYYLSELWIYDEIKDFSASYLIKANLVALVYNIIQFYSIFKLNALIINRLEIRLPWKEYAVKRIIIEFISTTAIAFAITAAMVLIHHYFIIINVDFLSDSEGLKVSMFYNLVNINTINIIFIAAYEIIFLYRERKRLQLESERQQKENILSQFETLKNQINPHFLFNSMNALSNLIENNPEQATQFTREFSKVFRHILELKENAVVEVSEELDLLKSYLFLQKTRFEENLIIDLKVGAERLSDLIPPFSLQLMVENAIKHNEISSTNPLHITIEDQGNFIIVKNNLQMRGDKVVSTKVGLRNLKERYKLLSEKKPEFFMEDDHYTAKLPLLYAE
ncbi:MAG: histidine kinase [Bacteroidota bacterium]